MCRKFNKYFFVIFSFLLLLLYSTGLTSRPDTSILYSRIGILIVIYSLISSHTSFFITHLEKGIGLYGGLFNTTSIIHTFQIFILLISGIILLMTAFYPRKICRRQNNNGWCFNQKSKTIW